MRYRDRFRIAPGCHVDLSRVDPGFMDRHENKESAGSDVRAHTAGKDGSD